MALRRLLALPCVTGETRERLARCLVERQALETQPNARRVFDMPLVVVKRLALTETEALKPVGADDGPENEAEDWRQHGEGVLRGKYSRGPGDSRSVCRSLF